jgi:hypothetical protein
VGRLTGRYERQVALESSLSLARSNTAALATALHAAADGAIAQARADLSALAGRVHIDALLDGGGAVHFYAGGARASAPLRSAPADAVLCNWLNHHLAAAGSARRVANFGASLADGHIIATVVARVAPGAISAAQSRRIMQPLEVGAEEERAADVCAVLKALGLAHAAAPKDLVQRNSLSNFRHAHTGTHKHTH